MARKRIVIVGAGFGGMAAATALKHADADVTLIDRTNHHLFQPLLYQVATAALSPADIKTLKSLGVEVRTGAAVDHIDAKGLAAGPERITTRNILWCAGTAARPAATWLSAEPAKNGAVKVAADCSVPGHPTIFALGDVASNDAGGGRTLPGLAPVAKQQGAYVGALLKARIAGRREPRPFHYRDLGTLAVIGRSRAVADFGWLRLTGFAAWLTWSLVHLMLLVDFRSRLMVYAN
jgi:NADH dehydrogenase